MREFLRVHHLRGNKIEEIIVLLLLSNYLIFFVFSLMLLYFFINPWIVYFCQR